MLVTFALAWTDILTLAEVSLGGIAPWREEERVHNLRDRGLAGAAAPRVGACVLDSERQQLLHELAQCARQPLAAQQADQEPVRVRAEHDLVQEARAELARLEAVRTVHDVVHSVAELHKLPQRPLNSDSRSPRPRVILDLLDSSEARAHAGRIGQHLDDEAVFLVSAVDVDRIDFLELEERVSSSRGYTRGDLDRQELLEVGAQLVG